MSQTEALDDYRFGGGHISNEGWSTLYHLAREAYETGELVAGQPWETPIPGTAYTKVDLDYSQPYVVIADVRYEDAATGERVRRSVTIEDDDVNTWDEIEDYIQGVVAQYGVVGGAIAVKIERARFLAPSWAW
jgi:hypothetical protein